MDHPLLQLLIGSTAPPKPLPPNATLQLRYELWLRDNHKWLLPTLDTARMLFLPCRFQESGQLSSEAVYTGLNVLSAYHDHLLDNPRAVTAEIKLDPQSQGRVVMKVCQSVLMLMHYSEVLIEMAARKYLRDGTAGEGQTRSSWTCIAGVEAIKALCRLCMLYANRGHLLTPPSQEDIVLDVMSSVRAKQKAELMLREQTEYEADRKQAAEKSQLLLTSGTGESTAVASASSSSSTALTPLTSSAASPPNSFSPRPLQAGHLPPLQVQNLIDLYVTHGRQTSTDSRLGRPHGRFVSTIDQSQPVPRKTTVAHVVSEIMHIVRPIVYTAARAKYADTAPESWIPFFMSLSVDAASRALAPSMASLSRSELEEVSQRIRGYLFYLLRDPMFNNIVAAPLARFSSLLARIPILGTFLSSMLNIVFSVQTCYFYTSAS